MLPSQQTFHLAGIPLGCMHAAWLTGGVAFGSTNRLMAAKPPAWWEDQSRMAMDHTLNYLHNSATHVP